MFNRIPLIAATATSFLMAVNVASANDRAGPMVAKAKPKAQQMMVIAPRRTTGIFCPEGWVQATPPLNWQLGCLPNTLTLGN